MSEFDKYRGPIEARGYHLFPKERHTQWTAVLTRKINDLQDGLAKADVLLIEVLRGNICTVEIEDYLRDRGLLPTSPDLASTDED